MSKILRHSILYYPYSLFSNPRECGWQYPDTNPNTGEPCTVLGDIELWGDTYLDTGVASGDYDYRLACMRTQWEKEMAFRTWEQNLPAQEPHAPQEEL